MFHGMYEHKDEYGHVYHLSARIGGFTSVESAVKAVAKRSDVGYISDSRNVVLHVIRNGKLVDMKKL